VNDATLVAVQRVRNVLRANTAFSVIAGLAVAGSSAWLTRQLAGTPTLALAAIGLGVVAFGIIVLTVSVSGACTVWRGGRLVAVADLVWVAISIPIIMFGDLTAAGVAVVAVVGTCVLALAVAEVDALRQLSPFAASLDSSRLETVRRSVDLAAPGEIGWEVVSDHELYGRLAPNLSAVHVLSDSDHGQRRCVARSGESWTESCDVFHDDRRYEVSVDTTDYPYPLVSMAAVFRVDEIDEQHCRASAVFRYERQSTVRGALLAAGMPTAFAVIMRRITNGWAIEAQQRAARPTSRTSS